MTDREVVNTSAGARQARFYETILNSIRDCAYVIDHDGHFLYANPCAVKVWGLTSAADAVGKGFAALGYPADTSARLLAQVRSVFETGQPLKDETTYPGATGEGPSTYEYIIAPVFAADGSGRVEAVAGSSRDVTSHKRIEDDLRASEAREHDARVAAERAGEFKDQFMSVLSHELRTPLSAILLWVDMLIHGKVPAAELAEVYEQIQAGAEAQRRLIDDLLDVSRIGAGKLRLDLRDADVAAAVRSAVDVVRPTAAARGVALDWSIDPPGGDCTCRVDPDRVQQVVWNLLTNAVKFTGRGGRVTARVSRATGAMRITVNDTGIGIAPGFLPHVFELFRQADGGPRRGHGGLGLGLSICRRLVEMHGGTIRADSAGEGSGATFTVELPLAPPNAGDGI